MPRVRFSLPKKPCFFFLAEAKALLRLYTGGYSLTRTESAALRRACKYLASAAGRHHVYPMDVDMAVKHVFEVTREVEGDLSKLYYGRVKPMC